MGWSIYLMLAMVAIMVLGIVFLIVLSEKKRKSRLAP
jgi:preprotein translocase subunit YajC